MHLWSLPSRCKACGRVKWLWSETRPATAVGDNSVLLTWCDDVTCQDASYFHQMWLCPRVFSGKKLELFDKGHIQGLSSVTRPSRLIFVRTVVYISDLPSEKSALLPQGKYFWHFILLLVYLTVCGCTTYEAPGEKIPIMYNMRASFLFVRFQYSYCFGNSWKNYRSFPGFLRCLGNVPFKKVNRSICISEYSRKKVTNMRCTLFLLFCCRLHILAVQVKIRGT